MYYIQVKVQGVSNVHLAHYKSVGTSPRHSSLSLHPHPLPQKNHLYLSS